MSGDRRQIRGGIHSVRRHGRLTARASDTPPDDLVHFLNRVFTEFDRLVELHGLEKSTGDAYVVVSGLPTPRLDQAEALAALPRPQRGHLDVGFQEAAHLVSLRYAPIHFGIQHDAFLCGRLVARADENGRLASSIDSDV